MLCYEMRYSDTHVIKGRICRATRDARLRHAWTWPRGVSLAAHHQVMRGRPQVFMTFCGSIEDAGPRMKARQARTGQCGKANRV